MECSLFWGKCQALISTWETGAMPMRAGGDYAGSPGTFDYGESVSTTWPPWPIIPVAVFALVLLSPIYREILSRL